MTDKSKRSQCNKIVAYMAAGHRITSLEAIKRFGCLRLASRIHDLKEAGYPIGSRYVTNENTGTRYKEYWLVKEVS